MESIGNHIIISEFAKEKGKSVQAINQLIKRHNKELGIIKKVKLNGRMVKALNTQQRNILEDYITKNVIVCNESDKEQIEYLQKQVKKLEEENKNLLEVSNNIMKKMIDLQSEKLQLLTYVQKSEMLEKENEKFKKVFWGLYIKKE